MAAIIQHRSIMLMYWCNYARSAVILICLKVLKIKICQFTENMLWNNRERCKYLINYCKNWRRIRIESTKFWFFHKWRECWILLKIIAICASMSMHALMALQSWKTEINKWRSSRRMIRNILYFYLAQEREVLVLIWLVRTLLLFMIRISIHRWICRLWTERIELDRKMKLWSID